MISNIEIRIGNADTVEITVSDESGDHIIGGQEAINLQEMIEGAYEGHTTYSGRPASTPHIS